MFAEKRPVLIVDDEEDIRVFVRSILEAAHWDVIEAENGQEALDLAESESPTFIVMDVMMPVMDGFDTFKRLREGVTTSTIPVIMLTGVNDYEEAMKHDAETMEADLGVPRPEGFVEKPVDPDFLLVTIQGIVG
ncbi:MAG: response regulator [bacterium]|nr:response regulator [bacterium]